MPRPREMPSEPRGAALFLRGRFEGKVCSGGVTLEPKPPARNPNRQPYRSMDPSRLLRPPTAQNPPARGRLACGSCRALLTASKWRGPVAGRAELGRNGQVCVSGTAEDLLLAPDVAAPRRRRREPGPVAPRFVRRRHYRPGCNTSWPCLSITRLTSCFSTKLSPSSS